MQSSDDDTATSGVEAAIAAGVAAVPSLVEALLANPPGYSEYNYYLCKALGSIGDEAGVRAVLRHLVGATQIRGYGSLLRFFTDPDLLSIRDALASGDEATALAKAKARLDRA